MQQELDRAAEADKAAALLDLAAGVEGEGAAPAASDSMRRKHGIGWGCIWIIYEFEIKLC